MKVGDLVRLKPWKHFEDFWAEHGYDFSGPEEIEEAHERLQGRNLKILEIDSGGHIVVEDSDIHWLPEDFEKL
jgi:hypothetical protein